MVEYPVQSLNFRGIVSGDSSYQFMELGAGSLSRKKSAP